MCVCGEGGGHTCSHKTQPRVSSSPISINSSGLARLDASWGVGGSVIPALAVSWQSAEQRQKQIRTKRNGQGIWISSWLDKRMWWEHPGAPHRGDATPRGSAAAPPPQSAAVIGELLRLQLPRRSLCCLLSFCGRSHEFPNESKNLAAVCLTCLLGRDG